MLGKGGVGEKELLSLADDIVFVLLFLTLLNLASVQFQPRLYLFLLSKASLKDLKLDLFLKPLDKDRTDVLGDNFA
jgi:hypothetical protein